ncbi:MAG TPA: HAMP domain-containing sensor histidine kinase [Kofleriaceae bacterium]|nr:HAMP domain-containing sensor histidine kinase [Kofleriaceae bacterium]
MAVKVATRITVATALVVALVSASYAYFDLRSRRTERRAALEREARAVATALRLTVESQRTPSDANLRDLARNASGWKITVLTSARASTPPLEDETEAQLRRLNAMIMVPKAGGDIEAGQYYYDLPIRAASERGDPAVVGMLEVARTADVLDPSSDDLERVITLAVLTVGITTVMVGVFAVRMVSRPITKLLGGIDDVAKGDLSHVILSERDDEIGAIATRFNEMTFSLRESRGETQRQNEAKLALEQRLGQTEKLATLGQLAAEIAHEVGTPLNVIAGRARSIQRKSKEPDTVEKNAGIIAEQTARITRIIQRLLDFTRRKVGATAAREVNLNDIAQSTIELLAGQFASARVKVRFERAAATVRVAGDSDRLQQVLINLLLNAVQAMPDGGSLLVETATARRTRPGLEGGAEQDFVSIAVTDTGVGIPADIKDKIFDPFYTTKEGQGGTGLGLAVVSGIVKEHDGWIDVEDAASAGGGAAPHGTIFRVFLPA